MAWGAARAKVLCPVVFTVADVVDLVGRPDAAGASDLAAATVAVEHLLAAAGPVRRERGLAHARMLSPGHIRPSPEREPVTLEQRLSG